ncbi:MAG: hypothetical protein RL329_3099 [Bacteroidota bacterium]|jgi:hypothetical protein
MKINEINSYLKLKKEPKPESALKSILKTTFFKMLLDTEIILKVKSGRGYLYAVAKLAEYEQFLSHHYQEEEVNDEMPNHLINAVKYNDSKFGRVGEQLIFVRGFKSLEINNLSIDLTQCSENAGVYAIRLEQLKTQQLCYVENLKCFLVAERLLGKSYIYFHPYGRPSKMLFGKLEIENLLFCPDYDYVGLNDYIRCKQQVPQTELYLPDNYQQTIQKKAKKALPSQTIPNEVLKFQEESVQYIVDLLQTTNLFLEQEVLFI